MKFIEEAKQGIYAGIFKDVELKMAYILCSQTTPPLCFGLIFVQGKLNLEKIVAG